MFASFVSIPVFPGRITNVGKVMYIKPFMSFTLGIATMKTVNLGMVDPFFAFTHMIRFP